MENNEDRITDFFGNVITVEEAIQRHEISSVVKRFGTWVVTTRGVESLVTHYTIHFERLDEPDWFDHMREKKWVNMGDFATAFEFAQELFNKRQTFLKSGQPLKAFLCHAKEDKQEVREFYNKLHVIGIQPWFDEENLLPGQDWQHEIKNAVRDSDVVIVCLSKKSVDKTGFVQKEYLLNNLG